MHTYAEDRRGRSLSETWHFHKWGRDVRAHVAGPMSRGSDGQDYFVYEPALALRSSYYVPVMPICWFMRDGQLYAKACSLLRGCNGGYVIDAASPPDEIPLLAFKFLITKFEKHYKRWGIHNPHIIEGALMHCVPSHYTR
jgi:hypothetical protein